MIEIKNLSKQFQNETEIAYRDMTFETGKSYMLLGASGCGKSTLLNMIAGILSPTNGFIKIDGMDMTAASQREKDRFRIQKIGYVFQDFKLINDMTVADNIGILRLEGIDVSAMDDMLRTLDMYHKKNAKIKHLSGGQKQRVAIVRALVKHPHIILADEPTGNLDPKNSLEVMQILEQINQRGITVIVSTHDYTLVDRFRKRVLTLENGEIIRDIQAGTYGQ